MEEKVEAQFTPEQVFEMYENRIQEQTAIIFALVNKFGGEVAIKPEDFQTEDKLDSVFAENREDDSLVLRLGKEPVSE